MERNELLCYQDLSELVVVRWDIFYATKCLQALERNNPDLDFQDVITNLGLLYYSIGEIGYDADNIFNTYAQQSLNYEFKSLIYAFLSRDEEEKSIEAMGFTVHKTPYFHFQYI